MVLREQLLFMARGIYDDVQVLGTMTDTACHLDDIADIMAFHKNIVDVGILDIDAFFVTGGCNPKKNTGWDQTAVCNRLFSFDHILIDFGKLFLLLCALLIRDVGCCGKGTATFFGRERDRHGIGIYGCSIAKVFWIEDVICKVDAAAILGLELCYQFFSLLHVQEPDILGSDINAGFYHVQHMGLGIWDGEIPNSGRCTCHQNQVLTEWRGNRIVGIINQSHFFLLC